MRIEERQENQGVAVAADGRRATVAVGPGKERAGTALNGLKRQAQLREVDIEIEAIQQVAAEQAINRRRDRQDCDRQAEAGTEICLTQGHTVQVNRLGHRVLVPLQPAHSLQSRANPGIERKAEAADRIRGDDGPPGPRVQNEPGRLAIDHQPKRGNAVVHDQWRCGPRRNLAGESRNAAEQQENKREAAHAGRVA